MRAAVGFSVFLLSLAVVPGTEAQNLVVNGDFDSDVSGWRVLGADLSVGWDSSDYAGKPSSGSLLCTNDSPTAANYAIDQCVDSISEGESYRFVGWVEAASGQTADGYVELYWYWRDAPSCGGTQTKAQSSLIMTNLDEWTYIGTGWQVAPEGTVSAQLVLVVNKYSVVPGTYQVYYDGLDFRGSDIFADDFESSDTTAWSSAVP